eukprot:GHVS01086170.1.p1 GENE.GHVS01086170.1~~GHVS01086170.1.p1  ORF type:complete len:193 (+),score=29.03 GHVS01086170.1:272-850(+)
METLIGIRGKDFVMVASDKYAGFSIYRMKNDEDKIMEVDDNKLLAAVGPIGDRTQFGEYMRKNIHLYRLRTGLALRTSSAACFTRVQMAEFLRQNPYQVDLLLAGCDKEEGPQLYWLDYLASLACVDKAAHGYGAYFVYGILDRHCHSGMTEEQAIDVMKLCVAELKTRFIMSQSEFNVKVITAKGIKHIEL